jgi:membrane protease YdiL (CAAX protease family)
MALYQHSIQMGERGMKILRFPVVKLVIALSIYGVLASLAVLILEITKLNLPTADYKEWLYPLSNTILNCGFALLGYWIFVSLVEGRPVTEVSKGFVKYNLIGIGIGVAFISLIMGILALLGYYRIDGLNANSAVLQILSMSLIAGVVEEVLLRGYFFRFVEEALGTWFSVAISALLFGFLHAWNPNASFISSLSIALTAGVVLALLFAITRNLWIVIGMHYAWNFTLGGIYGAPVSGGEARGFFKGILEGPELLTGGDFGPEASVITVMVFTILSVYLVFRTIKSNQVVKPFWKGKNNVS